MFQGDFALSLSLSSLLALWPSSHLHLYSPLTELGNNPSFLCYMNAYINCEQVDNEIPVRKSACPPGETGGDLHPCFLVEMMVWLAVWSSAKATVQTQGNYHVMLLFEESCGLNVGFRNHCHKNVFPIFLAKNFVSVCLAFRPLICLDGLCRSGSK